MVNKKFVLILMMILCIAGLVAGAWYFIIQGNMTAYVYSIGGVNNINIPFPTISLNTTNSSDRAFVNITFVYNKAGNFTVEILETYIDNSAGECTEGAGDCIVSYTFRDGITLPPYEIYNGQQITIPFNNNPKVIIANMSCVAYACPQTKDLTIKLREVMT